MIKYIIRLLVVAGALLLAEHFVSGIIIDNFWPTAVFAAFIFGVLNITIRPVLKMFAFPINFITLGFVGLLINVFTFWLINFLPGVEVDNFMSALFGFLIIAIVSWIFDTILG